METTVSTHVKASDLRIGSKLLFNEHMLDVFMFDAEMIYEYYSATCTEEVIPIKYCEGIPLSREILDKYGYVKEGYNSYRKQGSNLEFSFSGNEVSCVAGSSHGRGGVHIATIQYLHQLQNLVYLLTGKELEMIL